MLTMSEDHRSRNDQALGMTIVRPLTFPFPPSYARSDPSQLMPCCLAVSIWQRMKLPSQVGTAHLFARGAYCALEK